MKRKEIEESNNEDGNNEDNSGTDDVKDEYTKEELNRLYKNQVLEIANKLGLNLTNKETKKVMIKKIVSQPKKLKEFELHKEQNSINDFNRGALEYALPWIIIQEIFTIALKSPTHDLCTCVNHNMMREIHQDITKFHSGGRQSDKELQKVFFATLSMKPLITQYSLKREDLCPMHQNYLDCGSNRQEQCFIFAKDQYRHFVRTDQLWKRSMALLSKRIFTFLSPFFSNVVVEPTSESWNHFKNEHCIIKKPTTVTFVPTSQGSFPKDNHFIKDFFEKVEKVHIKGCFIADKIDTFRSFANYAPCIRKLTLYCEVSSSILKEVFVGFKNLADLDLSHADLNNCKFLPILQSIPSTLRKIFISKSVPWNKLPVHVKNNLVGFSTHFNDSALCKYEEFPKLQQIYCILNRSNNNNLPFSLPETLTKATLFGIPYSYNSLKRCVNLSKLKIFEDANSVTFNFSSLPLINKIIIYSHVDVVKKDIDSMAKTGFKYIGSSLIVPTNRQKIQFIKQSQMEINQISITNHNNVSSSTSSPSPSTTSSSSSSTTIINNNPVFQNPILFKIIGHVWKLRNYCTCSFNQDIIQRWLAEGFDVFDDPSLVDYFHQIKSECPIHGTFNKPYKPFSINTKDSMKAKLQLALINKEIFKYISENIETTLFIGDRVKHEFPSKRLNPYVAAFKNITSIRSTYNATIPEEYLKTVTKAEIVNCQNPLMFNPYLTNLQSITFMLPYYTSSTSPFDITKLSQIKSLTKIDFHQSYSGITRWADQFIDVLKELPLVKKLYLPNSAIDLYERVPEELKKNITSISVTLGYNGPILQTFTKLEHLLVLLPAHNSKNQSLKIPSNITRINANTLGDYLEDNPSIHTLKYEGVWHSDDIQKNVKRISECAHINTFILKLNHSDPSIPTTIEEEYGFKIIHSKAKFQKLFLIFERIEGGRGRVNDQDDEDDNN